jgi:tRNA (cmo5U34)-methyltransferase
MQLGDSISKDTPHWDFGGNVPENFVKHMRRSIPFYDEGHEIVCRLSDFFCRPGSLCYELGVSTGQLINNLAQRHAGKESVRWVGIDSESAMLDRARTHCTGTEGIEFVLSDVEDHAYEPCDCIVSYYCIQFVPRNGRSSLVGRLYDSLNKGGGFIWFEKVRAPDARFQDILSSVYQDFKMKNGYTCEEIMNKSMSLRGILDPMSSEENHGMLREAGFRDVTTVMKYLCFEGVLAVK